MSALTLKEKAYVELRQMILDEKLKPGDVLTERTLVEMLDMSRTPIRAALERLDAEGLANYTPNKGLIVAEVSLSKAIDLYEFRIAMECYVVKKLASSVWSDENLDWFEQNLREQEKYVKANDYTLFTVADAAFHHTLARVIDNSEILHAMERLHDKLYQIAIKVLRKDHKRIEVSYNDHVRIYKLIREGNTDEAVQAMEDHLQYGKQILIM